MRRRGAETPGEGGLFQAAFAVLARTVLAFGFIPRLDRQNTRMARQASSKPDSGSPSIATIGFEANLHPSHTLATLRDTLLPKLLSGEVSVLEVHTEKEAAV